MGSGKEAEDARRRRCPRLGHEVAFRYCRCPGRDLPCGRIVDCWWEAFDVQAFLRAHYTPEAVARVLAPPPDKVATLMQLIQRAQQAARPAGPDGGEADAPPEDRDEKP